MSITIQLFYHVVTPSFAMNVQDEFIDAWNAELLFSIPWN